MTLRDKLEIGLKPDAPYRQDNLPEAQQDDPECVAGAIPGTDPAVEKAREHCDQPEEQLAKKAPTKTLQPKQEP